MRRLPTCCRLTRREIIHHEQRGYCGPGQRRLVLLMLTLPRLQSLSLGRDVNLSGSGLVALAASTLENSGPSAGSKHAQPDPEVIGPWRANWPLPGRRVTRRVSGPDQNG